MRGAVVAAVVAALAGCHAGDPCAGKSGVCLTVEATGSGLGLLDQLLVGVTDGSGNQQTGDTGTVAPRIELPVQFAALLRPGTSGAVSVDVSGVRDGSVVADGVADVVIPASGRAKVTVQLGPTAGGDEDMAGGGGSGGDGGGGLDLGTSPSLSPASIDLRVIVNQTGTSIFTVNTPVDVMLGQTALTPAVPGLQIDANNSTCMNGMTLLAKHTCSIVVLYAPTKPDSHTVSLQIATTVGTPTSSLRALSPGLIVETLATSSPPTFKAVSAVDPVHVWAVGDNNTVYYRDGAGWHATPSGPGAGGTMLDSVWAFHDDDVYVGSSGVFTLFRTTNHGVGWGSSVVMTTGGMMGLAGVDDSTIYTASAQGEITVGSWGAFVNDGHPSDGLSFDDLEIFGGNVFATRADQVLLRNPSGTPRWNAILNVSGTAHFYAAWGSTGGDFYAVGQQTPCAGSCSTLQHKLSGSPPVTQSISGCDAIYDVWGEAEGGGFGVYAVGMNGTFVTTPNGDSWSQYTTSTTAVLYGVGGAAGEIYAVGAFGTILHLVR